MKTIYLYGISGADQAYRVLKYQFLMDEDISIREIVHTATMMQVRNPSIEHVYAIDNRRGLRYDLQTALKKNSIENWAIFKDILEREGLQVI